MATSEDTGHTSAGHNASSTDRASCSVAMATAVADCSESFVGQSHLLPDGLCLALERLPLTGFLQRLVPASSQAGLHVTAGAKILCEAVGYLTKRQCSQYNLWAALKFQLRSQNWGMKHHLNLPFLHSLKELIIILQHNYQRLHAYYDEAIEACFHCTLLLHQHQSHPPTPPPTVLKPPQSTYFCGAVHRSQLSWSSFHTQN